MVAIVLASELMCVQSFPRLSLTSNMRDTLLFMRQGLATSHFAQSYALHALSPFIYSSVSAFHAMQAFCPSMNKYMKEGALRCVHGKVVDTKSVPQKHEVGGRYELEDLFQIQAKSGT